MASSQQLSVIIIAKNEAANISACISSARQVSDDIIVVDSGSTDATVYLAGQLGVKVVAIKWLGFGAARNEGAANAHHDWILAIDADERLAIELVNAIKICDISDGHVVYGFKRVSFFLGKKIRFGDWGRDSVFRFYNRNYASWDLSPVHEEIVGTHATRKTLRGVMEHYTVTSKAEHEEKTIRYAKLSAEKYFKQGKKASVIKRFLSPAFAFIKCYIFLLGFLDGKAGYTIAKSIGYYAYLKYNLLYKLNVANRK